jgi:hypothetical protein
MVEQKTELRHGVQGLHRFKALEVFEIKRDDMRETMEIVFSHLARTITADVDPVLEGNALRAPVGRLADMPMAGAREGNLHIKTEALDFAAESRLRERRAADVSEANKED